MSRCGLRLTLCLLALSPPAFAQTTATARRPRSDSELRRWLENMAWYHRYSNAEMASATGLSDEAIESALARFDIRDATRPADDPDGSLRVLPYPGGRHPRIGFLDGAIDPQRETKFSVFTPWDPTAYVVVDLPEAIWSNLGLTYLAHTHIDTIWTKAKIELEPQEWLVAADGSLTLRRELPNKIAYEAKVRPAGSAVDMELSLTNGSPEPLSDLRVQVCVMLKGAPGFEQQTNDNKVIESPCVAVGSTDRKRWIITKWEPIGRVWSNPPCPCLHADPKLPDCPPGETVRARGKLWFYQGDDILGEIARAK